MLRHVGGRLMVHVLAAARRYDRQTVVSRIVADNAAAAAAADAITDSVLLRCVMPATVMQLLLAVVREHFVRSGAYAVRVPGASRSDNRRTVVVRAHAAVGRHHSTTAATVVRRWRFRGHRRIAHF